VTVARELADSRELYRYAQFVIQDVHKKIAIPFRESLPHRRLDSSLESAAKTEGSNRQKHASNLRDVKFVVGETGTVHGFSIDEYYYQFIDLLTLQVRMGSSGDSSAGFSCMLPDDFPACLRKIRGQGESPELAREQWARLLHSTYEKLKNRIHESLNEDERILWESLFSTLEQTHCNPPLTVEDEQVGFVRMYNQKSIEIAWIDGRSEFLSTSMLPPIALSDLSHNNIPCRIRTEREVSSRQILRVISFAVERSLVEEPSPEQLDLFRNQFVGSQTFPTDTH
jgi:hypothetical protein